MARLIEQTSLIIWDETPMIHRNYLKALDKSHIFSVTSSTEPAKPFGGLTIVLGGDFRQILPVVQSGSKIDIVNVTIN